MDRRVKKTIAGLVFIIVFLPLFWYWLSKYVVRVMEDVSDPFLQLT